MLQNGDFLRNTEMALVEKCIKNDRQAQNMLFNLYSKKMMTICLRYSRNREDAEDVLTEGFMRIFNKLHLFKATGSLEGWMRRVIVNVAIEKFKTGTKLYQVVDLDKALITSESSEDIYSELNAKELLLHIQSLPPVYKMVFNLYVFEGFKHKEIAAELGISEGTSKSNLSDDRSWLKKRLEEISIEKKAI